MAAARSAPTPGPSPGATRTSLGEGRGSEPRYGNRGYGKAATGEEAGMAAVGSAPFRDQPRVGANPCAVRRAGVRPPPLDNAIIMIFRGICVMEQKKTAG